MATVWDAEEIRKQMGVVKAQPCSCAFIGCMKLTYSTFRDKWVAEFDCDLEIFFDDVAYSSNNIILKRDGVTTAMFCHMHQRP